ncbi:hypothetical protein [Burkholderia thailandensis]|uniref:hypothetical protein n=1 Tax=Burkholderia thailandensis TaxID=57975 RepID=UPI000FD625B6|nr:hypothetical protein [Burkholderia thailandensis]NBC94433.1 hypothetical protein [Burkholderia thailandensis]
MPFGQSADTDEITKRGEVTSPEMKVAKEYAAYLLHDLYDDYETVLALLREKNRIADRPPSDVGNGGHALLSPLTLHRSACHASTRQATVCHPDVTLRGVEPTTTEATQKRKNRLSAGF